MIQNSGTVIKVFVDFEAFTWWPLDLVMIVREKNMTPPTTSPTVVGMV